MGLLSVGQSLGWKETKSHAAYIREHGVQQFIHNFQKLCSRQGDCLKWGDEIEYMVVRFDDVEKRAVLTFRGSELLDVLNQEELQSTPSNPPKHLWRPEYAAYMIEGTPGTPYGGILSWFNHVEENMRKRREAATILLGPNEALLSIGSFPRLGCPGFTYENAQPTPHLDSAASKSLFFPDEAINPHPRFATLTRNIRERRGSKIAIHVPIFKDTNTPEPFIEDLTVYGATQEEAALAKPDHIYMDAMGFGMGCCCLQVTFQAVNVCEARWLYDQLTPITPVLLALSAATPVFRGYLADVDSRWDIISASVDDRTPEELVGGTKSAPFAIPQSRYGYTQMYLYPCSTAYNDIDLPYNAELMRKMVDAGIDSQLATHIAHLFIRDPVMIYGDRIHFNDTETTEHFENIQSSNWQNMRFKPPPADNANIGWRVEFRPTEVQLTDFENAAYVVFVVLLTRVLISFRLSLLIPISKVNENMERAQKRDAVRNGRFFFRSGVATCNTPPDALKRCGRVFEGTEPGGIIEEQGNLPPQGASAVMNGHRNIAEYREMSIDEIINGSSEADGFPGLVPLMFQYLDSADVEVDTRCSIQQYLRFIQKRASGEILTTARWVREFVRAHPDYQQDSRVSERINYDMLKVMQGITTGAFHCPKLLGNFKTKPSKVAPVDSPEKVLPHPKFPVSHHVESMANGAISGGV